MAAITTINELIIAAILAIARRALPLYFASEFLTLFTALDLRCSQGQRVGVLGRGSSVTSAVVAHHLRREDFGQLLYRHSACSAVFWKENVLRSYCVVSGAALAHGRGAPYAPDRAGSRGSRANRHRRLADPHGVAGRAARCRRSRGTLVCERERQRVPNTQFTAKTASVPGSGAPDGCPGEDFSAVPDYRYDRVRRYFSIPWSVDRRTGSVPIGAVTH